MMEKVKELLTSRKFIVTLIAITGVTVLAAIGKIDGDKALDFAKWVLGAWIAAQAGTDISKQLSY
jgi:hypothetical protein